MIEQAIEQEIQEKGKVSPRITPYHIDSCIASEHYFTAGEGVYGSELNNSGESNGYHTAHGSLSLLTFCVLVLRNGFTVTGESACASPENFDAEIGRKVARQNAREKIWALEGYALKTKLSQGE